MSSTLTTVGTVISVAAPLIFIATAFITISDLKKNHSHDKEKLNRLKHTAKPETLAYKEGVHEEAY